MVSPIENIEVLIDNVNKNKVNLNDIKDTVEQKEEISYTIEYAKEKENV